MMLFYCQGRVCGQSPQGSAQAAKCTQIWNQSVFNGKPVIFLPGYTAALQKINRKKGSNESGKPETEARNM